MGGGGVSGGGVDGGRAERLQACTEFLLAAVAVLLASDALLILSPWGDARLGFAACLLFLGVSERRWRGRALLRIGVAAGASVWGWITFTTAEPLLQVVLLAWLFGGLHLAVERRGAQRTPRGVCPAQPSRFLILHLASLWYGLIRAVYCQSDRVWSLVRWLADCLGRWANPTGTWASGFPIYLFGFLILLWQVVLQPPGTRRAARSAACLGLLAAGLVAGQVIRDRLDAVGCLGVSLLQAAAIGVVGVVSSVANAPSSNNQRLAPVPAGWGEQGKHDGGLQGLLQAAAPRTEGIRSSLLAVSPRAALSLAILAGMTIAGLGWGGHTGTAGSAAQCTCGLAERDSTESHCCNASLGVPDLGGAGPTGADSAHLDSGSGSRRTAPASFAIYSSGMVDWAVPDSTRVGLLNSGMFGLFRRSLERCAFGTGGKVIMFDSLPGSITPALLEETSVVVFINPTTAPSDAALRAIRDYVLSGGGLLVLGDHTDIMGSRAPLNAVLGFTNIRFNFDSAVPLRQHWRGCLEVRRHALDGAVRGAMRDLVAWPAAAAATRGLSRDPNLHLQIAVGASLDVARPAFPVVVGRYGFADGGDPANGGSQAFMGNLKHDRGERLGDVVLVAAEEPGLGRVLVFGDTSPFQNGALFFSQDLVGGAIRWLAGGNGCAPVAQNLAWSDQHALIDFSTRPQASAALFDETSLGGLANCLAREGIAAHPAFSPAEWVPSAPFLFLTAPTRMAARDVACLLDYMEHGGNVILSEGYAEPQPCEALLLIMGLAIRDVPLGRGDPLGPIEHKDAYAIRVEGTGDVERAHGASSPAADAIVVARAFDHPTVVMQRYGKGTLTLVSDGRFFLDANLEGERSGSRRNIRFIHDLIDVIRKTTVQEIATCDGTPGADLETLFDGQTLPGGGTLAEASNHNAHTMSD